MYIFKTFDQAIGYARDLLRVAPVVHSKYWQGVDISKMREAATAETLHYSMRAPMIWKQDELVADVRPDLPWADDHFAERVSGKPINPPPSEEWWPHAPPGQKNEKFKTHTNADGQPCFSHSYPERLWGSDQRGQRFSYGDLNDVAALLAQDPMTRQAFIPIWWPEDGGSPANERKPCTIGYQFIVRPDRFGVPRMDCVYTIRSCDYKRHFRNDIYFAVLLARWMSAQALGYAAGMTDIASRDLWATVQPGKLIMHITSLHLFYNDYVAEFGKTPG